MRTKHAKSALWRRLERLEASIVRARANKLRFGHIRELPREYQGDRHVIIAKRLGIQDGNEWVEYEERPGPRPPGSQPDEGVAFDIVFVVPNPTSVS